MCDNSLTQDPRSYGAGPRRYSGLICPQARCRQPRCTFTPAAQRVVCGHCGWQAHLDPAQVAELCDALSGVSILNTAAYLIIVAAEAGPPPATLLPAVLLRHALIDLTPASSGEVAA
jgi:hypothetical protein